MPKINHEEYRLLKSLGNQWKWIARDEDLSVYDDKPVKVRSIIPCWDIKTAKNEWQRINRSLFQFIQWEDEEPWNVQELIEEYEYSAEHAANVIDKRLRAIGNAWKESEGIVRAKLQNLISPKSDVDRAYKAGYETGKQHTYYKGYLEGFTDREKIELKKPTDSPEVIQHKEDEDMGKAEELRQEDHDPVHRPQHYMQGHIETIDKIKLLLTPEEYLGYLKGNVIKYGDRAPFKGNAEQDYDKQKIYYDWALTELED